MIRCIFTVQISFFRGFFCVHIALLEPFCFLCSHVCVSILSVRDCSFFAFLVLCFLGILLHAWPCRNRSDLQNDLIAGIKFLYSGERTVLDKVSTGEGDNTKPKSMSKGADAIRMTSTFLFSVTTAVYGCADDLVFLSV